MFSHHSELAYTVHVDKPNPVYARMLQQAIGGPEGEMRVMTQYLFQGWNYRGPRKYKDMLMHTGTEEIGHIEILATAVALNLQGAPAATVDEVVTNPLVAARMGGVEPRHFLTTGLGATANDANGVPFSGEYATMTGNLISDMRANVTAESVGRTLALRLLELTDDPGMIDMWKFLIARDTMHQNQWLAALEDLGAERAVAPGDYADEPEYRQHSYAFFAHSDTPVPPDARWASGPSIDGEGEFTVVEPPRLGQPLPHLQAAPAEAHDGLEASLEPGQNGGMLSAMKSAAGKVMPG